MELSGRPKINSSDADPHEVGIFLTVNFNEQWEKLPGGHIKFGLRSGELRLHLSQGCIPYAARNLAGALALSVQKERQSQLSSKEQSENQRFFEAALNNTKAETRVSAISKKETSFSQGDSFDVIACQVTTKGNPYSPAWVFEVQTDDPVLKGSLVNVELARMDLLAQEWKVEAIFQIPTLKDIKITEADGPWLRNASPSKRMALELGLAKLLIKHKLTPYLSQVEFGYE